MPVVEFILLTRNRCKAWSALVYCVAFILTYTINDIIVTCTCLYAYTCTCCSIPYIECCKPKYCGCETFRGRNTSWAKFFKRFNFVGGCPTNFEPDVKFCFRKISHVQIGQSRCTVPEGSLCTWILRIQGHLGSCSWWNSCVCARTR